MSDTGPVVLAGVLTLVPGLIVLAIGVVSLIRTIRFLQSAAETTGAIVDLLRGEDGYSAVVEFKSHEGRAIRWTQGGQGPRLGNIGDEIPMRYNPKNPKEARIARVLGIWGASAFLTLLGLMLTGTGVLLLFLSQ
jgi:hypothetical protein